MYPDIFENLLIKIHDMETYAVTPGHPELPLEKQLMITLWCLSNLESFGSVADRFGISKSTCWAILYRISEKLIKLSVSQKIIAWPSRDQAIKTMTSFKNVNHFPGVIGVIDGTHIKINKPKLHPNSYVCRKQFHSVLLQGICDSQKLFLDVYAGQPGSIHDSRLFSKSEIYSRITNRRVHFYDGHLIGDLAYKLTPTLMVAFKNNGNLMIQQKNYNYRLSQIRVVIENAFGLLKGRFRRLKFLETVRLDLTALLIVAACVLHNICILANDTETCR